MTSANELLVLFYGAVKLLVLKFAPKWSNYVNNYVPAGLIAPRIMASVPQNTWLWPDCRGIWANEAFGPHFKLNRIMKLAQDTR